MSDLHEILQRVAGGQLAARDAETMIHSRMAEPLGFATIDHHRARRCGSAEVIYSAGKTPEQVVAIAKTIRKHHPVALATRCRAEHIDALRAAFDANELDVGRAGATAIVGKPDAPDPALLAIPIVTAGTSDEPVAEEAAMTCRAIGHPFHRVTDVGVAGLHRLGGRLAELRAANVIVCIAGMEGALPSVLAGLVDVPVIGVPTSVGYGAALNGLTPLLSMLTSCAGGVSVVNIDNGFGGAMAACLINRLPLRKAVSH